MPNYEKIKEHVTMTVIGEGLRMELMETEKGMFFEIGRPEPSPEGRDP